MVSSVSERRDDEGKQDDEEKQDEDLVEGVKVTQCPILEEVGIIFNLHFFGHFKIFRHLGAHTFDLVEGVKVTECPSVPKTSQVETPTKLLIHCERSRTIL